MTARCLVVASVTLCLTNMPATALGESISECQEYFRTGAYEDCLNATTEAIESRSYGEEWPLLKARCELVTGKYGQAVETVAAGLERYSWSVRLLMLQHECALATGNEELADASLTEIERLVQTASWRYTDADDLVALGHAAVALGVDPRDVLEGFFDRARRNFKTRADGFIAAGRLAIQKGDFELAGEILLPASETFDDNPELLLACSEAIRSADSEAAGELLNQVLDINPHHLGALQQVVKRQIDLEDYAGASETIQKMLAVNSDSPSAHALQAVIDHLRNDTEAAAESVRRAMVHSGPSAEINHLIGTLLSRRYRFQEAAGYQRAALEADAGFVPARTQLAQDLLRLGQDEEGWKLANEAHEADGYNMTVFNLLQLQDSLDRFTTLRSDHVRLRMETSEADVYGHRALELLEEAWQAQSERYGYAPTDPVIVEIYPRADDFAVRTFGIPDVAGFLGVCFGKVVTANSPATRRDNPSNWESVLWHEFCHVITLQMTANRIPRWLSEGISVHEERRRDDRWGHRMTPGFRDRILEGRVTPVSQLSSAFLTAEDGEDLNFAYYESSMVVEFIIERFGLQSLTAILRDLNEGLTINDALSRNTIDIGDLDAAFAEFLEEAAESWAPAASFEAAAAVRLAAADPEALAEFVAANPGNYPAGLLLASQHIQSEQFNEAEELLRRLISLAPEDRSQNGARPMLATLYRRLERTDEEESVLRTYASTAADDLSALQRLQQLAEEDSRWEEVLEYGLAVRAIDPFQIDVVRRTATAAEELGRRPAAIDALRSLTALVPDDAARFYFRMAKLLRQDDPESARKHLLLALEQAPRYRAAHRLLLELREETQQDTSDEPATEESQDVQ